MKTVLHVIDTTGPGGAETIFTELVLRLDPARWRALAAVPHDGHLARTLRGHGVEPVWTPTSGRALDVGYLWGLLRLVRRHRVDLIQTHLMGAAVYGALAGMLSRVPVVCTLHGTVDVAGSARRRAWKWRLVNRAASAIVFVSAALRDELLADTQLDPDKVAVIPNGIDLARYAPGDGAALRQELAVAAEDVLVVAVGNIRAPKAYDVLLRAAARLRTRSDRYRVVIAGEGEGALLEDLEALRDRLGLTDRVRFLGFRPDVPALLRAGDVLVSSSSSEGFSLSVIQALACGTPVVATRSGGPQAIVADGVHALLVPPGAPDELADAIERVAGDPALRTALTTAGRALVAQRYGVERMVDDYATLYDRHLQRAPGRP